MAGKYPMQSMSVFNRHYIPNDDQSVNDSARGKADEHHTNLKRNAEDISRSLSEVFAYLTHGTASL
jgi:hypothetical protein